jgi:regulator of replication initiation timing
MDRISTEGSEAVTSNESIQDRIAAAESERESLIEKIQSEKVIRTRQSDSIYSRRRDIAVMCATANGFNPEIQDQKKRLSTLYYEFNRTERNILELNTKLRNVIAEIRALKIEARENAERVAREARAAAAAKKAARSPAAEPHIAQHAAQEAEASINQSPSKRDRDLRRLAFSAADALANGDVSRATGFVYAMDLMYPDWRRIAPSGETANDKETP